MIPIIYLYFHAKIWKNKGEKVRLREFKNFLSRWHIPKNLHSEIVEDMKKFGLINFESHKVILNQYYIKQAPELNN